MKPFKFVHAADLHLDSPFKGMASRVPDEIVSTLRDATAEHIPGKVTCPSETGPTLDLDRLSGGRSLYRQLTYSRCGRILNYAFNTRWTITFMRAPSGSSPTRRSQPPK